MRSVSDYDMGGSAHVEPGLRVILVDENIDVIGKLVIPGPV
jgi:hypothetical protein